MAETVICRIIPTEARRTPGSSEIGGSGRMATLEIISGGAARRAVVSQPQNLKLSFGDKIKCLAGAAVVMINPGTPTGTFILTSQIAPGSAWNVRAELAIDAETTRIIDRGKISVHGDIGTVLTGGTATTR